MDLGRFTSKLRSPSSGEASRAAEAPDGPDPQRLVGADNWYRTTSWTPADQEFFEAKLARARKANRAQYVRIQGSCLTDSEDPVVQEAGAALLRRVIDDYADDAMSVADAHAGLARWNRRRGDTGAAADALRATLKAEQGTNVEHGADLDLAALIAEDPTAGKPHEAERLLDAIIGGSDADLIFRSQQFIYALARSRLAERCDRPDRAAAYACGALWLADHDGPTAARHSDVGLIGDNTTAVLAELTTRAGAGDAEGASAVVEEFRRRDGSVSWEWGHTSRLHERPRRAGAKQAGSRGEGRGGAGDSSTAGALRKGERTAEVLAKLRAAGFEVFDLKWWTLKQVKTMAEVRVATDILLGAIAGPDDDELHWYALVALHDRRAAKQAALPMIELLQVYYRSGQTNMGNLVGNLVMSFARDEHLHLLEPLIRDPSFPGRSELFWAVAYMKSEAAVELALEMVNDDEVEFAALHALSDMKTEKAFALFTRLAAQEPIPLTRKQSLYWHRGEDPDEFVQMAERRNGQIEVARHALGKLERARAKGKSRHAG